MWWCDARTLHPLNSGAVSSPLLYLILSKSAKAHLSCISFDDPLPSLILPAMSFGEGNDEELSVQSKSGGAVAIDTHTEDHVATSLVY